MSGRFGGEHVVVVGAGVAGSAAARVLLAEGATVVVTESAPDAEVPAANELRVAGADVRTGGHRRDHLDGATLVVTGPGVPPAAEVLRWADEAEVPVWGELELGARLARTPYLAVTGTNGKTTTTGMVAAALRAGGIDAVGCGNIGHPFPLAALEDHETLVVEASSFQLATQTSFHPRVSVLLNLAPDHLDWHGSYDAYVAAKASVFVAQGPGDVHIGNRDDPQAAALSSGAPCEVRWFRDGAPSAGETGFVGDELIGWIDERAGLGRFPDTSPGFRADAAAAAAAALSFGVAPDAVTAGLAGFVPPRHRGEVVAEVGGVRFVDDSKATNVHAALAAIDGAPGAVLIAGGRAKGVDLSPLATRAERVHAVVAIGEAAEELARVFGGLAKVERADSIELAVAVAFEMAPEGGTVLLAPACASWDQFTDYAERGDRFTATARALGAGEAAGG